MYIVHRMTVKTFLFIRGHSSTNVVPEGNQSKRNLRRWDGITIILF